MATATRAIHVPHGTSLARHHGGREAALRMLARARDCGGAERPADFIGYLQSGTMARPWPAGAGVVVRAWRHIVPRHDAGALVIGIDPRIRPSVGVVPC